MKGDNECLEVVAEIYRQYAVTDIEIVVVWRPWTESWQMPANALSKYEDNTQCEFNPRVYELILIQPSVWVNDRWYRNIRPVS